MSDNKEKPVKEKGKKRNLFARFVAVIVILAIVIGIIFVALPSPARALEEMFRDLKAGKIEEANKYVDYKELANIPALGSLEESTEEVKDSEFISESQEICDTYINIKGEVLDKYLYK